MNAPEINPEQARALYTEREKRLYDTIALKTPDRVPIIYYSMFWHARNAGMTIKQSMYDYEALSAAVRKIVVELQPDAFAPAHMTNALGPTMELMGYRQLKWPGNGTDDTQTYQYIDGEYMKPSEYDEYIEDPSWFYMTKFLPRVADVYAPFASLPQYAGHQHLRLIHNMRMIRDPKIARGFERMARAGDEAERMFESAGRLHQELASLGFPLGQGVSSMAPYDYFADYMRGSKGAMLDMFRRKDKLLEAMDRSIPIISRVCGDAGQANPCKIVFFPMHWGLDGFMSLPQFKTFFWPQLRRVLMNMIDRGLIPMVLWEGDCTSRLETIADIPRGKAVYWFERTDLARAKAVLGDTVCLRGNVPPSMLNMGTPDEVREYCRNLIKTVGKNGGLILDGGIGIPDEAKAENVRAMHASVREFGRYA